MRLVESNAWGRLINANLISYIQQDAEGSKEGEEVGKCTMGK